MKRKIINNPNQPRLFDTNLSEEAKAHIYLSLKAKQKTDKNWKGLYTVPPGTLLDTILSQFQKHTNIPLEIPYWTVLHTLAGYLCKNNVCLNVTEKGKSIKLLPDIWTLILAKSGGGKTFTSNTIREAIEIDEIEASGAVSTAALFDVFQKEPRGLWIRDEFLQFYQQIIKPNSPLSEAKDLLLRMYDGKKLERISKKNGTVTIDNPAISWLTFNVTDTFIDSVDANSVIDGFLQRITYCIAKDDKSRNMRDYPMWMINTDNWQDKWSKIKLKLHDEYISTKDGIDAFKDTFYDLANGVNIPESYYRRVLWRTHKLALLYHIIREVDSNEVNAEDYGWATRSLEMQLSDVNDIVNACSNSDLEKYIQKCEEIVNKEKVKNPDFKPTARFLLQRVKGLNNAGTAKFVFEHYFKKD